MEEPRTMCVQIEGTCKHLIDLLHNLLELFLKLKNPPQDPNRKNE